MRRFLAAAAVASAIIAGPAMAQTNMYTFSGQVTVTITAPPACNVTGVTLPATFSAPANNAGMTVGPVTYTSDIPCSSPPMIALDAGSPFVLSATAFPANLVVGPANVAAGTYTVAGSGTTRGPASASMTFKPATVKHP